MQGEDPAGWHVAPFSKLPRRYATMVQNQLGLGFGL